MAQRPRMLLIATDHGRNAATMRDHVAALRKYSRFEIHVSNNYRPRIANVYARARSLPEQVDLEGFDAVAIHYTCEFANPISFDPVTWERLRAYRGLKVLFLQDEYQSVQRTVDRIAELGIDVLFTCVAPSEWEKVYPASRLPSLQRVHTLTGFVPDYLLEARVPALAARAIDVGYRARVVPYWLGELGAEKWQIGTRFLEAAQGSGLRLDISVEEKDRLYGAAWTAFIARCKAFLGVESGASVFDMTGGLRSAVEAYQSAHPRASFEEVQAALLLEHEHRIRLNQISPRCFETAALRTAMILYEGEYSGILRAGRHYISLRKDFSNLGEVIDAVRREPVLRALTEAAYEEVALNPAYSFKAFVGQFDDVIGEQMRARDTRRARGTRSKGWPWSLEGAVSLGLDAWLAIPGPVRQAMKTPYRMLNRHD